VTKIAIVVFVPIYTAFDALAGVGTGTLVSRSVTQIEESTGGEYWRTATGLPYWQIKEITPKAKAERRVSVGALCLSPDQSPTWKPTVDAFWNSAPLTATAVVGSIAWVIAMLSTAAGFIYKRLMRDSLQSSPESFPPSTEAKTRRSFAKIRQVNRGPLRSFICERFGISIGRKSHRKSVQRAAL
jgi:hypothetical protein